MKTFFTLLLFFSTALQSCYARTKEPVYIIYMHGFNAFDRKIVECEAKRVAEAFQGRSIGNYCFSGKYKVIFWADMFQCDEGFKLYESALMDLNNAHNNTNKRIELSMDKQKLNLLNPFLHPSQKGSGPASAYLRNLINGFLFQIFFVKNSEKHRNEIMNRIQTAVDSNSSKFVIIAHSFGAPAAVEFLETRIIGNKNNEKKFAGLITSADLTATFSSVYWAECSKYDPIARIAEFIIKNDKFWICCNHRNDIAASGLPAKLTGYKAQGNGIITSRTTKSKFLSGYTSILRPFAQDNGKIRAHSWLHLMPDDFANEVIKAYDDERLKY